MSRNGKCLDITPMKSFFGSFKTELVHQTQFTTGQETKASLSEYIVAFYHHKRRNSSINYRIAA